MLRFVGPGVRVLVEAPGAGGLQLAAVAEGVGDPVVVDEAILGVILGFLVHIPARFVAAEAVAVGVVGVLGDERSVFAAGVVDFALPDGGALALGHEAAGDVVVVEESPGVGAFGLVHLRDAAEGVAGVGAGEDDALAVGGGLGEHLAVGVVGVGGVEIADGDRGGEAGGVAGDRAGQLHRRQRDGPADGVVEADVGVSAAGEAEQQEPGEAVYGVSLADARGRRKPVAGCG